MSGKVVSTGEKGRPMTQTSEQGVVLLLALITAVLVSILGLSLTLQSLKEFRISELHISAAKAFAIAEAGLNVGRAKLDGGDDDDDDDDDEGYNDFTAALNDTIEIPVFFPRRTHPGRGHVRCA